MGNEIFYCFRTRLQLSSLYTVHFLERHDSVWTNKPTRTSTYWLQLLSSVICGLQLLADSKATPGAAQSRPGIGSLLEQVFWPQPQKTFRCPLHILLGPKNCFSGLNRVLAGDALRCLCSYEVSSHLPAWWITHHSNSNVLMAAQYRTICVDV